MGLVWKVGFLWLVALEGFFVTWELIIWFRVLGLGEGRVVFSRDGGVVRSQGSLSSGSLSDLVHEVTATALSSSLSLLLALLVLLVTFFEKTNLVLFLLCFEPPGLVWVVKTHDFVLRFSLNVTLIVHRVRVLHLQIDVGTNVETNGTGVGSVELRSTSKVDRVGWGAFSAVGDLLDLTLSDLILRTRGFLVIAHVGRKEGFLRHPFVDKELVSLFLTLLVSWVLLALGFLREHVLDQVDNIDHKENVFCYCSDHDDSHDQILCSC